MHKYLSGDITCPWTNHFFFHWDPNEPFIMYKRHFTVFSQLPYSFLIGSILFIQIYSMFINSHDGINYDIRFLEHQRVHAFLQLKYWFPISQSLDQYSPELG